MKCLASFFQGPVRTLVILSVAGFFVITGCQAPQKSTLTAGNVKRSLTKGKTNQAEVLQALGSPNIVTRNAKGDEVWTYSKQSYDSTSGSFGGGLLLLAIPGAAGGSTAFSSSSSKSFDLIIIFDKTDVVTDYTMVSSQF